MILSVSVAAGRAAKYAALVSALRIQIPLQLLRCRRALDPFSRHFRFGSPKNRVQHHLPKILVTPVLVKMRAGETEASPAVRPLTGPGDMLRFAAIYGFAHRRIALVGTVPSAHGAFGRNGGQNEIGRA